MLHVPESLEVLEDDICCLGSVVLGILYKKVSELVHSGLVLLGLHTVVL